MYPINNFDGIVEQERNLTGSHVIVLMLIKPSDKNADDYIKHFNYWHYNSREYCSIYLLGYSQNFTNDYQDVIKVNGIDNTTFDYSDCCFIEVRDQLKAKLSNWSYTGEPEIIILQRNAHGSKNILDFSYYNYIDINYGIQKKYIDSFERFMERLIVACRQEVTATEAIDNVTRQRLKPRRILESALEACPKLPKPIKAILGDRIFYKSYNTKEQDLSYTLTSSGEIAFPF